MNITRDPGSFRDEAGQVFHVDGRIIRSVGAQAARDYRALRASGLLASLEQKGWLIESQEVDSGQLGEYADTLALEHPVLPFISYPYEWGFSALKAAALLTLDIHIAALAQGATLIDASAFNVQFRGPRPVFIDVLSLRSYRDGEFWRAQNQFCAHFLSPLLLGAHGIAPNAWYRGSMDGIPAAAALAALPWHWKMRWTVLSNLVLPALFQQRMGGLDADFKANKTINRPFPKSAFLAMLEQLRHFVTGIRPKGSKSLWRDYERHQSYSQPEQMERDRIVQEFMARAKPEILWDMGCNTGHFSLLAIKVGVRQVIGFDFDTGAIEIAYHRARESGFDFLPLVSDAGNPSPDQGWRQAERRGLAARRNADAIIALAFLHHLAVGKNIPLREAVGWLVSLAPTGLIEFVPKTDHMVQRMIALRRDKMFGDYDEAAFAAYLERYAHIVNRWELSPGGRCVYEYRLKGHTP